ncbi:hypothetical protein AA313_de0201381 [Arthrobotrys entomopaga]|nr:hypothetical protein AA313_de0201381 [Arthrobotrys entomopaga]
MASETQSKLDAKSQLEHGAFNSGRPIYHETMAVLSYRENNGKFNANEAVVSLIQQTENISLVLPKKGSESSVSESSKKVPGLQNESEVRIQNIPRPELNIQNIPKSTQQGNNRPENEVKPQSPTYDSNDSDGNSDTESEDELVAEKLQWNDREIKGFCREKSWGKAEQYLKNGLEILRREDDSEFYIEYHLRWTMTLIVVQGAQQKWKESLATAGDTDIVSAGSRITGFFEHWQAYCYHKLGNLKSARRHCKRAIKLKRDGATEEPDMVANQHLSAKLMVDILIDMGSDEWELGFYKSMFVDQLTLAEMLEKPQIGEDKIQYVFVLEQEVQNGDYKPQTMSPQEAMEFLVGPCFRTSSTSRPVHEEPSSTNPTPIEQVKVPKIEPKHLALLAEVNSNFDNNGKIKRNLSQSQIENTLKRAIEKNDLEAAKIWDPELLLTTYEFRYRYRDQNSLFSYSNLKYTSTPLYHAIAENKHEMISLLLEKGYPPNDVHPSMTSAPLHFALELTSSSSTIMSLINGGADVNLRDDKNSGRTPLIAVIAWRPKELKTRRAGKPNSKVEEYVEILLQAGADPTILDNVRNTALQYAVQRHLSGGCVKLLLQYTKRFEVANGQTNNA